MIVWCWSMLSIIIPSLSTVQGHGVKFPAYFCCRRCCFTLQDDRCWLLTVAGGVAVGAGQAAGAGDALADAVAHVAGRGGPELVDHEGAAVPHGDVELPDAALPVLVDAGSAGHHPLGDGGHGACKY